MKNVKDRFRGVKRIGIEESRLTDFYHQILNMGWLRFFAIYVLCFLIFNLFFALIYWLEPGSVSGVDDNFFRDFSFSVQTFSTIGYGIYAPATPYAHAVVIIESMFGVLATAFLTGLAFAKLTRPTAKIRFSDKVLILNYNGRRTLMFRMANLRGNQIAEATVKAVVLKREVSSEGYTMRVQKDLSFVRGSSSFFILSWSVLHLIDETSPLFGLSREDILRDNIELSVTVMGYDETFSQTVHASCVYAPDDFVFDRAFEDILSSDANGFAAVIDYTKFNTLKEAGRRQD